MDTTVGSSVPQWETGTSELALRVFHAERSHGQRSPDDTQSQGLRVELEFRYPPARTEEALRTASLRHVALHFLLGLKCPLFLFLPGNICLLHAPASRDEEFCRPLGRFRS